MGGDKHGRKNNYISPTPVYEMNLLGAAGGNLPGDSWKLAETVGFVGESDE